MWFTFAHVKKDNALCDRTKQRGAQQLAGDTLGRQHAGLQVCSYLESSSFLSFSQVLIFYPCVFQIIFRVCHLIHKSVNTGKSLNGATELMQN